MALVNGNRPDKLTSTTLMPTASLQDALKDFANCLSNEQRTHFEANVANPDAASVILFIGEIDAANQSNRKSAASRLSAFLNSVQQFSGAVDSFVSSNPAIAGLIWGSVKTTLITAQNVSSYFDKVTALILAIGRQCPTYSQFGHLYKDYVEVQQSLCEYYATIIRICTKIIEVQQKSGVGFLVSAITSPFDSVFKPLQSDLEQAMQQVNLQVLLASQQASQQSQNLIQQEHNEARLHRGTVSKFFMGVQKEASRWQIAHERREALMARNKIMDNFSTVDCSKIWSKIQSRRMTNTAEWFQQEDEFTAWQTSRSSSTLWCFGPLGVGKTVLTSSIILHLSKHIRSTDRLAHHFCRAEENITRTSRGIIGSLARQLLIEYIQSLDLMDLRRLERESESLEPEAMISMLCENLNPQTTYYMVIDGIDECDESEVATLASALHTLRSHQGLCSKLLLCGRRELFNELFKTQAPDHKLSITKDKVKADNDAYIQSALAESCEMGVLKVDHPETLVEVASVLERGCDGMFLWLTLFIEELCAKQRESEIIDALKHPPKRLSDLFNLKLDRVRSHPYGSDGMMLLKYCGALRRPLTIDEIKELLGVTPLQKSLDPRKFPQRVLQIIASCCGLLRIDEDDKSVHYAHHSIKTHLFTSEDLVNTGFVYRDIDLHLGQICLTYLNFNDFQRQLVHTKQETGPSISPMDLGLAPVMSANSFNKGMATGILRLWGTRSQMNQADFRRMMEDLVRNSRTRVDQYFFLEYAKCFWALHTSKIDESSPGIWRMFEVCIQSTSLDLRKPWNLGFLQGGNIEELMAINEWALTNSHDGLLLYSFLYLEEWQHKSQYDLVRKALRYFISSKSHLVEKVVVLSWTYDRTFLRHILHYGAHEGNVQAVSKAMELRVDLNAPDVNGRTALHHAASNGHQSVCTLLLLEDVGLLNNLDHRDRTPFQLAVMNGHIDVAQFLHEMVQVDEQRNPSMDSTLYLAISSGNFEMIKTVLGMVSNKHTLLSKRQTALHLAATLGWTEVVKLLIRYGYQVNALNDQHNTPIQLAASRGHFNTIKTLIKENADVNAASNYPNLTALHYAASNGKDFTRIAEPYLKDSLSQLHSSSPQDYLQTVKVLLEAKAKHWEDFWETSPLSISLNCEAYDIMRELAVADMNDGHGQRAVVPVLLDAVDAWSDMSLATLIDAGARLDIYDEQGRYLLIRAIDKYLKSVSAISISPIRLLYMAGASIGDHYHLRSALHASRLDHSVLRIRVESLVRLFSSFGGHHDLYMVVESALRDATVIGCPGLVQYLLSSGIDVNTVYDGNQNNQDTITGAPGTASGTPLQIAAALGHLGVTKLLLARGAKLTENSVVQKTPMEIATQNSHSAILKTLQAKRATWK